MKTKRITKFTPREQFLLEQAIDHTCAGYIEEITELEKQGGNPLFTVGFVKREWNDLKEKLKLNYKAERGRSKRS